MGIIKTENLTKTFGGLKAVNNVSLTFQKGQFTAIIGPNGAGKSTYFNLLSGRYRPTSGALFFDGENVTGLPTHELVRRGIGRSFQITNIFPGITAFENIRTGVLAYTGHGKRFLRSVESLAEVRDLSQYYLELVGLGSVGDEMAGSLSYGDQRRLEIGLTLTSKPRVLLLDEPTAGMTPEETEVQTRVIKRIAEQEGLTVILTEHDMSVIFAVSERIVVLQNGIVIADGTQEEIKSDRLVREAYLGEEA